MDLLQACRKYAPLVHCITNYVTVNDCANVIIASGGRPLMADEITEMTEIAQKAEVLVINIGTLNQRTFTASLAAGKAMRQCGKMVLLDPVGIGVSTFRQKAVQEILTTVKPQVIRGNFSEILTLISGQQHGSGVDMAQTDQMTQATQGGLIAQMQDFCQQSDCVLMASGPEDLIVNSQQAYLVQNGHALMKDVTGTGCQLSALTGALLGAGQDWTKTCLTATCMWGLAGEKAAKKITVGDGNASYRNYLIDAVYQMTDKEVKEGANYVKLR